MICVSVNRLLRIPVLLWHISLPQNSSYAWINFTGGLQWNDGVSNLYTEGFPEAGFVAVGTDAELQTGDVILMQIRSKNGVPNHAAIYLGDGLILHHLHGRLSSRGCLWRLLARSDERHYPVRYGRITCSKY